MGLLFDWMVQNYFAYSVAIEGLKLSPIIPLITDMLLINSIYLDINDFRIKTFSHLEQKEYIRKIQTSNGYLSCSRSEGWNLPLIEAMACGIPSIYSDCALNDLQNSIMLTPFCPIAGPIGGACDALPASHNNFNKPATFFGI